MHVVIIGRGKVGKCLAQRLSQGEHRVTLEAGRRAKAASDAEVVILTVPDDQIAEVAGRLSAKLEPGTVLLHCAGSRGPDELQGATRHTGVMHPMASFADARHCPPLAGTRFIIDGTSKARRAAARLARDVGATPVHAAVHGPAYHAAAAMVAGGAVALAHRAVEVLCRLGMGRRPAAATVAGLLRTVAANVESVGLPGALTGPVARGDLKTIGRHRRALAKLDRSALRAYDAIAPVVVRTSLGSQG